MLDEYLAHALPDLPDTRRNPKDIAGDQVKTPPPFAKAQCVLVQSHECIGPMAQFFMKLSKNRIMETPHHDKNKPEKDKKQPLGQPDPETLHTTDPEEHMEGPISSVMQKIKEEVEDNDAGDRKEPEQAARKKTEQGKR